MLSEIMNTLLTDEVKAVLLVLAVILVLIYALCIVWVARDAYMRNANWIVWTIVAVVPLVGVLAYCLLRPSFYQIDKDEQELEIAVKRRELLKYGECGNCGYPVEEDYILCPNCLQRLKNLCPTCRHALEPSWRVCPYCATPVINQQQGRERAQASNPSPAAASGVEVRNPQH